jgi:RNA polymerase sigma-70 factor, ECF subfamily
VTTLPAVIDAACVQSADMLLFARAQSGDEAAFTALYGRHMPYIAAVVRRLLGPGEDEVDDIVQETFCDALSGLASIQEPRALRAWLATVAVRRSHRVIRKRMRRRTIVRVLSAFSPLFSDPAQLCTVDALAAALDELPADLRVPWVLARIEAWRLEEVASACDVSLATVKRRLQQAEVRLAKVWAP